MEGTKHEKAVLVILSYIVGFTAGFITFGLTMGASSDSFNHTDSVPAVEAPLDTQEEAAAYDYEQVNQAEEVSALDSDISPAENVFYKDGRLMSNSNGASVLLSAQLATVDTETAKVFAKQGVHELIPNYIASDTGEFIYYCEQHTTTDSCTNFVYSVNDQLIQYVTVDGVKLISTAAVAMTAKWDHRGLTIGKATSANVDSPWKLVSAQ